MLANKISAGGGGTPTVTSATIQANNIGITTLTLNFSESCTHGAGGNGGVTVSPSGGASTAAYASGAPGAAFTYSLTRQILSGETVTRSYTQPGNGIEATTGGIDLATFTTQAVTNNSNVVALDAFTRGDGALGANWTDYVAGFGISSNQASVTASSFAIAAYSATTPTANARTSITLKTAPSANIVCSISMRYDIGAGDGYTLKYDGTTLKIDSEAGYSPTTLSSVSASITTNDVLSFETNGTTLTAYKNGTSVLSVSDGTYSTAQNVFISFVPTGSQTFAFDNFVLQNL